MPLTMSAPKLLLPGGVKNPSVYVCFFYCLIKSMLLANGLREYNQGERDTYRESRQSHREAMERPEGKDSSCQLEPC